MLAVDDDSDLLAATADQLQALGYRVLTTSDGATALALLACEPDIRLLCTDVMMPAPRGGVSLA